MTKQKLMESANAKIPIRTISSRKFDRSYLGYFLILEQKGWNLRSLIYPQVFPPKIYPKFTKFGGSLVLVVNFGITF